MLHLLINKVQPTLGIHFYYECLITFKMIYKISKEKFNLLIL